MSDTVLGARGLVGTRGANCPCSLRAVSLMEDRETQPGDFNTLVTTGLTAQVQVPWDADEGHRIQVVRGTRKGF